MNCTGLASRPTPWRWPRYPASQSPPPCSPRASSARCNKGYGTERLLLEGSFNDINPWQYQLLPQVLGGGTGWEVRTEGEFDAAIARALADTTGMNIIRVHIGLEDRSTTLDRLAAGLAKKVAR